MEGEVGGEVVGEGERWGGDLSFIKSSLKAHRFCIESS